MRGRLTQVTFRRPRWAKPLTEQDRDCQLSAELWIGVGAKMAKAYVPFLDDYEWHASHSLGAI